MPGIAAALLAAALLLPAAAGAQGPGAGSTPEATGFWNLLGVGQGETADAVEIAANVAGGPPPPSFESQRGLFEALLGRGLEVPERDLGRYFKPAGFGIPPGEEVARTEPRPGVVIARDRYGVPHVTAPSRLDAMFGSGYAQAADRLFFMDALRHMAQARLTELVGPGAGDETLEADARGLDDQDYTRAELDAQVDRLARMGARGQAAVADLRAYVDGVNTYIADARRDPELMPGEYALLGKALRDWTAADTVSVVALLTYFAPPGGVEHLNAEVLQALRARVGRRRARPIFDDLRAAQDPEAPATAERPAPGQRYGRPDRRAVALPDRASVEGLERVVAGRAEGGSGGDARGLPGWLRRLRTHGLRLDAGGHSNALLVGARRSTNGHPLFVAGPQVDFYAPPLFWEVELRAPGIAARGFGVPGLGPYVVIGHGPRSVFSATTAQSDLADVFVQRLCEPGGGRPTLRSRHVMRRGRCVPLAVQERSLAWSPGPADLAADPAAQPRSFRLRALRSSHGPVIGTARVGGRPVALSRNRSSYGRELEGALAFAALNAGEVPDARRFVRTMGPVPAGYNWFYADDRSIAHVSSGLVPRRVPGVDPDLPVWGEGRWDWRGFDPGRRTFRRLPVSRLPQAVDPRRGYLTSWNNRAAPGWRPADGEWQYGTTHRVQRLNRRLRAKLRGGRIDLGDLVAVMGDAGTVDVRGEEVLPWLLRVVGRPRDATTRRLVGALRAWGRAGARRADLDRDGVLEHSGAVALMDAWWTPMARAVFEPTIGRDAADRVARLNQIDALPADTPDTWFHGWHAYLHEDLRLVLGRRVRGAASRVYCGRGDLRRCRRVLTDTLRAAGAAVAERYGSLEAAEIPSTCPVTTPASCDQIDFLAAGGVTVPPTPWQDRGTAQQAVSVVPR